MPVHTRDIVDNPETLLKNLVENGHIPNALLFTGQKESGRKKAALLFAQTINCQLKDTRPSGEKPCGQCISCRKINLGEHPDIIIVKPEKNMIRISQIKTIFSSITSKPHEADMRMILIEDADTMNREASNSLLKILEEPPLRTFFVLTAKSLTDLLPTIISRCRHIRFRPVSADSLEKKLTTDHGVDPITASTAAEYGNGSLDRARRFANIYDNISDREDKIDWIKRRKWIINQISDIITCKEKDSLLIMKFAEKLSREKDLLGDSIDIIRTWLRDIAVFRLSPDRVINKDATDLLKKAGAWFTPEKSVTLINDLYETEKKIQANTVPRLTLEAFLFRLTL
ncbi:MAG: DNA polymerase III subunit delta' [Thermodesulfobacteriota bacterium]|nr:DNA polymerase III subunit delta' [Thermodesulfobacteriota bacterium]